MQSKILSLNVGLPQELLWRGRSVRSSMKKSPVTGPLRVMEDHIEGDRFADPQFHGTPNSVVYALGLKSAESFWRLLGRESYPAGMLGENLTLDDLDEEEVGAGDIFQVGSVRLQATYPRIPCGKVNFRVEHEEGQRALQNCGRSGVYFRVLTPGLISLTDSFVRAEKFPVRLSIAEIYRKIISKSRWSQEELQRARATKAALPDKFFAEDL